MSTVFSKFFDQLKKLFYIFITKLDCISYFFDMISFARNKLALFILESRIEAI